MRKYFRTFLIGLVTALCLAAFCSYSYSSFAANTPTAGCSSWAVTSSPNPLNITADRGIAAVSQNDIWMVGQANTSGEPGYNTMAEHWDGKSWSIVPTPNPSALQSLYGVAAAASNDVWAVGAQSADYYAQTLIEHWNGQAWSVVSSPNVSSTGHSFLKAVATTSNNDAWAIGYSQAGFRSPSQGLIEHWDGTSWSIIPSPTITTPSELDGVTAISANDAWVVGHYGINLFNDAPLIEHWDGTSWSVVNSPTLQGLNTQLLSVSALNSKDIWAVGFAFDDLSGNYATLMMHWDGKNWSIAQNPVMPQSSQQLLSVTTLASNNAWAVGAKMSSTDPNALLTTLTMHWDGKSWNVVTSPNLSPGGGIWDGDILRAVTHVPGSKQVWAAGGTFIGGEEEDSLVMHTCP